MATYHGMRDKDCRRCRFAAVDPDGGYCAHEQSLKESMGFGRSWATARREGNFCGPNGKLWQPMSRERMEALGIT